MNAGIDGFSPRDEPILHIAMWRRIFNMIAAMSLLLCLVSLGLWARSLGHFEICELGYARWLQPDEVDTYSVRFFCFSNTLRLEVLYLPLSPAYFVRAPAAKRDALRAQYPPGLRWEFLGDAMSRFMNVDRPGFAARHSTVGNPTVSGDHWGLGVRPWLPTLLFAILPAIWLYRYRRATRTTPGASVWQFGLRELFVVTTAVAVLVSMFVWLKN